MASAKLKIKIGLLLFEPTNIRGLLQIVYKFLPKLSQDRFKKFSIQLLIVN